MMVASFTRLQGHICLLLYGHSNIIGINSGVMNGGSVKKISTQWFWTVTKHEIQVASSMTVVGVESQLYVEGMYYMAWSVSI